MKLFLGVDGGQSSTTALIGDETGLVLGTGAGGPCNHANAAEGRQKLARAVDQSITAACVEAGITSGAPRFAAACFGMSGGAEDKLPVLKEIIAADVLVVANDAEIALAGATSGEPGIIVIAGTGSIAFGRNAAGRTARTGGWGHIFGDEGSAFDIVRQALRAALRQREGWGPATRALLEAAGQKDADAHTLMHSFYSDDWPRSRVAALAPLVDKAAMEGDQISIEILHNAAQQLALLTAAVRRQLWKPGEPVRVAWIGGVFRSRLVLERYRYLVELEEGARAGPPDHGPASGALLEAYRAAHLHPKLQWVPRPGVMLQSAQ